MKFIRILGSVVGGPVVGLTLAAGAALAQTPTITLVANASSYTPPGLPNSGIAQGAMFIVKGSGLGPATFVVATTFPLQTVIAGTSVSVTAGGKTMAGIMYYSGPTQLAAILPSSTPTGAGTLTVTYNGQTSAPAGINVIQNGLGIFTVSQSGAGDAVATMGAGFATPANSPNAGETVVFWGTGLGPVNFNEAAAAQQTDMTNVPLEAYIGGKSATILFRGRNACCTAVDTVYVQIPAGVSGCAVPVVFKIGMAVSNTTSIPIAASGRVCTPTNPAFSSSVDLTAIFSKPTYSFGGVSLSRTVLTSLPAGGIGIPGSREDNGSASFISVTVPPGAIGVGSAIDIPSYGSCSVFINSSASTVVAIPVTFSYLDAGASIGVNGPGGQKSIVKQAFGGIIAYSSTLDSNGNYLSAGQYTITGPGGPDVGSFSMQLALTQPLVWTNQTGVTSVNRANGITVNWTGGDPKGYVLIQGVSSVSLSATSTVGASFICIARTSDGSFTVPAIVLLSLPASGTVSQGGVSIPQPGQLSVASSVATLFQATGIDFGIVTSSASNSNQVTYQ